MSSILPKKVFPTLVGVFLSSLWIWAFVPRLPHARGGVSKSSAPAIADDTSSPRSWGCFYFDSQRPFPDPVFPTLVGVFLKVASVLAVPACLPHARGGVSQYTIECQGCSKSSPRSWGCFFFSFYHKKEVLVFPTLVGVFLFIVFISNIISSLPHARGGVSIYGYVPLVLGKSSPRSWGCFRSPVLERLPRLVFPTLVGVFPRLCRCACLNCGLPHARGGVSSWGMKVSRDF